VAFLSANGLAAAGLALDICGAAIVARGLLQSEREIAEIAHTDLQIKVGELSMGPFGDRFRVGHPTLLLSRVEDRVDGTLGVTLLALGFLTQAIAGLLSASGHPGATGTGAVVFGLAAMVATALVALGIYRYARPRVTERLLERVLAQPGVHVHFADACRRMHRDPDQRERAHMAKTF
jgi:hypothetical protein